MDQPCIPIEFYSGETFVPLPFLWQYINNGIWTPINLTNFTATFSARQTVNAADPPIILATTANGMITINGPLGSIQLILPASLTAALAVPWCGVWDLWAYSPSGVATRLFGGPIKVKESVTRA